MSQIRHAHNCRAVQKNETHNCLLRYFCSSCVNVILKDTWFAYFPGSFKELSHELRVFQAGRSNRRTHVVQMVQTNCSESICFESLESNQALFDRKGLTLVQAFVTKLGKSTVISPFFAPKWGKQFILCPKKSEPRVKRYYLKATPIKR